VKISFRNFPCTIPADPIRADADFNKCLGFREIEKQSAKRTVPPFQKTGGEEMRSGRETGRD